MPFHSKKDFATLCGIKTNQISIYVGRGKIVLSGELIDDTIDVNKIFITKMQALAATRPDENKETPLPGSTVQNIPVVDSPDRSQKAPNLKGNNQGSGEYYDLTIEQKRKDVVKTEEEITKLKLTNQKLQGDNIPTDLVKEVMKRHNQNLLSHFNIGINNILIEIEKMASLSREQVATMRGDMVGILNMAMENAVAASKGEIKTIVKEISVKRGRGERD